MENPENELIEFGNRWDLAMEGNNVDEISFFMSDEWVIIGTEGGITSKSAFLDWIRSGDLTHSTMKVDESRVKIYGDTGIVTSRGTSAGLYKGHPFQLYEWSTNVYIRKNGEWQCVLTMLTPAH